MTIINQEAAVELLQVPRTDVLLQVMDAQLLAAAHLLLLLALQMQRMLQAERALQDAIPLQASPLKTKQRHKALAKTKTTTEAKAQVEAKAHAQQRARALLLPLPVAVQVPAHSHVVALPLLVAQLVALPEPVGRLQAAQNHKCS